MGNRSVPNIIRNCNANAITYTPPTSGEIFKNLMNKYRLEN